MPRIIAGKEPGRNDRDGDQECTGRLREGLPPEAAEKLHRHPQSAEPPAPDSALRSGHGFGSCFRSRSGIASLLPFRHRKELWSQSGSPRTHSEKGHGAVGHELLVHLADLSGQHLADQLEKTVMTLPV